MAKRIVTKIGDVFCVEVDGKWKGYFQYIANDQSCMNSSTIRIFKKKYPVDDSPAIDDIVRDEVLFYAHTVLKFGIQDGVWSKVGKSNELGLAGLHNLYFGLADEEDANLNPIDPLKNWRIWKVNENWIYIGELDEHIIPLVEYGAIFPWKLINQRIKLGYNSLCIPEYEVLPRIPREDADIYFRLLVGNDNLYYHFVGENAIQWVVTVDNVLHRYCIENPGNEKYWLNWEKLWNTKWDYRQYISEEEFNSIWENCES
ncbi:hypothetical protein [uncultured Muribaculum sp.]|uniref:hypothetical protein n=1 Tax=uncultured Muribaculum sp. TaxID=1918613 RepID=UPI002594B9B4|nr:hypothetical protein [uncultured Muribaculum sp.]